MEQGDRYALWWLRQRREGMRPHRGPQIASGQGMSRLFVRPKTSKENKRSRALTLGSIYTSVMKAYSSHVEGGRLRPLPRNQLIKAMIHSGPHTIPHILGRVQITDRYATYLLKEDGNILLAGICLLGRLPVGVGDRSAVVVHVIHGCDMLGSFLKINECMCGPKANDRLHARATSEG